MALPVQFRGIPAVIRAYENKGVASFSLWCGSQFLHAYEGKDIEQGKQVLNGLLTAFLDGNEDAIATYTLKVYADLPKNAKIKRNTEDTGSFNFKLVDYAGQTAMGVPSYRAIQDQKLSALEEKFDKLMAAIEADRLEDQSEMETAKSEGIGSVIEKIFLLPGVSEALAGHVIGIIGKILTPMGVGELGKVAGPGTPVVEMTAQDTQVKRLQAAINKIASVDPMYIEHLEALADLAEKDPNQFLSLAAMLK